jgi:SAM-dependent methyltransferase
MPQTQRRRVFRRYRFLADLVSSGRLLEVGCGAALGNGLLMGDAEFVVSFDVDIDNLRAARTHVDGIFGCADAEALPFADDSFDAVAACEMLYYVRDQQRFVSEARRVLRPGGHLFITVANPERPGFHHSPMSTCYPTATELHRMLVGQGFSPKLYGVFPLDRSMRAQLLRLVARVATALHLVPKTLSGRGMLKRILVGQMSPFAGFEDLVGEEVAEPQQIDTAQPVRSHQVIYAVGCLVT